MGLWHLFFTCLVMMLVLTVFCEFEPCVALEARFNMELCIKGSCASMLQILWTNSEYDNVIFEQYCKAYLAARRSLQLEKILLSLPTPTVLKVVLFMQQKGLEGGILSLPLTFLYMFCSGVHIQRNVLKEPLH